MLRLSEPQAVFLNLPTKFRAFVGGYGSGKSFVGGVDLTRFAMEHPGYLQGYFAPTYRDIRDIFYPTIGEISEKFGITADIKTGDKEVTLRTGRKYYGTIICRSMDNPGGITGFKIQRGIVDEMDLLPREKAKTAWLKIIARLRTVGGQSLLNDLGVVTTPEGFRYVYELFGNEPKASYSMVQASTYENAEYLPPDYIPTLIENYSEQLANAYIRGQFVNLTHGTVYYGYNKDRNDTDAVAKPKEPLKIGMDFNVGKMAAAVYVERDKVWHQVDEIINEFDTPAMIAEIQRRYKDHGKVIYPDASGKNRQTVGASTSDIHLLKSAGYQVRVRSVNPLVRDRVISANSAYESLRVRVNKKRCPTTARCLEQLAYDKNGVPDKSGDLDHPVDAATYPIAYEMRITKPTSRPEIVFSR